MGGPMAYFAPGYRSHTAWAMTCAVECRRIRRPSGSDTKTGAASTSAFTAHERSTSSPSTRAAMALEGNASPMGAPAGTSLTEPSGSLMFGMIRVTSDRSFGKGMIVAAPGLPGSVGRSGPGEALGSHPPRRSEPRYR